MSVINNPFISPQRGLYVNGEFAIDQAHEFGAVTVNSAVAIRVVDRCIARFDPSTGGAGNPTSQCGAVSAVPSGAIPVPNSLLLTMSGSAGTGAPAALNGNLNWNVLANKCAALGWGTANAQPATMSVWLKCSVNATISQYLYNYNSTRSYTHDFVLTAGVWKLCTLTVPGDTASSSLWKTTPGYIGLTHGIAWCGGSNHQGTPDTWQTNGTLFTCSSNQTQLCDTAGATLEVYQPKVEVGGLFTGFFVSDEPTLWQECKFLYRKTFPVGTAPATQAGYVGALECKMNSSALTPNIEWFLGDGMWPNIVLANTGNAPNFQTFNPTSNNANWYDKTGAADILVNVDPNGSKSNLKLFIDGGATGTAGHQILIHAIADAGI